MVNSKVVDSSVLDCLASRCAMSMRVHRLTVAEDVTMADTFMVGASCDHAARI